MQEQLLHDLIRLATAAAGATAAGLTCVGFYLRGRKQIVTDDNKSKDALEDKREKFEMDRLHRIEAEMRELRTDLRDNTLQQRDTQVRLLSVERLSGELKNTLDNVLGALSKRRKEKETTETQPIGKNATLLRTKKETG